MKYKVIAMLCAVALILGAVGCGDKNNKEEKKNGSGQNVEETNEQKKTSKQNTDQPVDNKTGSDDENTEQQVVTGGFQLTLPKHVTPNVNDQGLVLSDEDMNYQMLITVRNYEFDSKKEKPEFFSEKVAEAGYEITKKVELTTVADREFAYFNYIDQEDNMLLSYSKADGENTFGVLAVRYGELSDEDILKQMAEILASAEKTDLPDTTADDIVERNAAGAEGSIVPEDAVPVDTVSMLEGDQEISVNVPETFYIIDDTEKNAKVFISSDGNVNAYLYAMEELAYESMEEWVKDSINVPEEAQKISKSEVQQEKAGDATVYYQVASYEEESSYKEETITYQELTVVCQMPNGIYLQLEADSRGNGELNYDMVKEFFTLSEN